MGRRLKHITLPVILLLIVGLFLPEKIVIPVLGATSSDWNQHTFWYEPWGSSGVHKGVDIFAKNNTPVLSASNGLVVFVGHLSKGGKVVAILSAKLRIHYYAHLNQATVEVGDMLSIASVIGHVGTSGNAAGKSPHLHYSILSLVPLPWLMTTQNQGWKRMFYLDPVQKFTPLNAQ
ncbi:MAG: M23 family metallopeptidase [Psychrobium sp.]|nr:M23 family metallopeptidase [Psychrobium sp.]